MTDWDERYRQGDTPWEKGYAAPPLIELLERMAPVEWGDGTVLVPGCGLGHDVRALAEKNLSALGLDLSSLAIERARAVPAVAEETYETGDFLDPGWRDGRKFPAIWEHTCFCAINPTRRDDYARAAAGVLVDGGLLAGVFFLTPYDPGEESAGPPHPTSIDELEQRFSRWFERIDGWVPTLAYPEREGREWIGLFRKLPDASVAG